MRLHSAWLSLVALASVPAAAQSINIDLGIPGSPPPGDYRGAGIPGHWNKFTAVQGSGTYVIYDLNGHLTGATLSQIGGTEIVSSALGGNDEPDGPDAVLLADALVTHTAVETCLFFNGLQNGTYEVTSYAWMPTSQTTQSIVHIDTNPTATLVGAPWSGSHVAGVTFTRHLVGVTTGFMGPHSGVPSGGNFAIGAALNGIQLRKLAPEPPLFPTSNRLTWLISLNTLHYDVVEGDLLELRATDGDFAASTTACVRNNFAGTATAYPVGTLAPGEGRFYLVRGNGSGGPYTWNSPGSSQVGSRDAEIAASGFGCD